MVSAQGSDRWHPDASVEPVELHGICACDACVNSIGEVRVGGPALEPFDHLGLDIYCDDAACSADPASEFKREEPHSGAWLKNRHTLVQIRRENSGGVMSQAADRTKQQISEPPRTYAMLMRFPGDADPCIMFRAIGFWGRKLER